MSDRCATRSPAAGSKAPTAASAGSTAAAQRNSTPWGASEIFMWARRTAWARRANAGVHRVALSKNE
eukprot:7109450-Alexandrium_andersonii.AAC.1